MHHTSQPYIYIKNLICINPKYESFTPLSFFSKTPETLEMSETSETNSLVLSDVNYFYHNKEYYTKKIKETYTILIECVLIRNMKTPTVIVNLISEYSQQTKQITYYQTILDNWIVKKQK